MKNEGTWLARVTLGNSGIRLLSLLLAVISWYSVRTIVGATRTIHDIPLVVKAQNGMAVVSQSHRVVSAVIQGSREDIARLDEPATRARLRAVVWATKASVPGKHAIEITPADMEGAKAVRATRIVNPLSVTVELDRQSQKLVTVQSECSGSPKAGMVVSVACIPSAVTARGAESAIEGLTLVDTEPVDVGGASDSFETYARVMTPPNRGFLVFDPEEVRVAVAIDTVVSTKRLSAVPVTVMLRSGEHVLVSVAPPSVDVVLAGGSKALERVGRGDVRVIADCGAAEPGEREIALSVKLPAGSDITAKAEPVAVRISLSMDNGQDADSGAAAEAGDGEREIE